MMPPSSMPGLPYFDLQYSGLKLHFCFTMRARPKIRAQGMSLGNGTGKRKPSIVLRKARDRV